MSLITTTDAVERLRSGQIVAVPTETVYGLAGRIDDEGALREIFRVKERPFFDPLIVHVFDRAHAATLAREWPPIIDALARAFWPGPLTFVVPKRPHVSDLITSGLESVGLRAPRHPLAREVLVQLGVPFAAPSANKFGRTSPTKAADVLTEFDGAVPVLDGGPCEVGVESTVISVDELPGGRWRINLLRPGGVSRADLTAVLDDHFNYEITRAHSTAAPGHLKAHYQPSNPVILLTSEGASLSETELSSRIQAELGKTPERLLPLQLPTAPEQAARVLYSEFRRLSQIPGAILVPLTAVLNGPDGEAIRDRLERAASLKI